MTGVRTSTEFHCLYLRKSRDEENDPDVLKRHRELMLRVSAASGIEIPPERVFEEIGSGERIESRPVFQRLLSTWERLPHSAGGSVGVPEMSRLSRGLLSQQGRVQDALMRANIHIRTPNRLYDLRQFEDRFTFNAFGIVSNAELELFKDRMARGRAAALRDGRLRTGRPAWGYIWDKLAEAPVPHPDRFPILQRLCREAVTVSVHALAVRYGIPESTLLWTLTNPMICGWPAQRWATDLPSRPYRDHGWRLPRDEWRWPEKPGDYPAACTRAEWEAIQAAIAHRALRRTKPGGDEGWCRDILRFDAAEGRVRLGAVRPPGMAGYLSYDLIAPGQARFCMPRDLVHAAAEAALATLLTRPGLIDRARAEHERQQAPATDQTADLRRQLDRERARLAGLKSEAADPDASEEDRLAARAAGDRSRRQIERLKADLAQAERAAAVVTTAPEWDELHDVAEHWKEIWEECPSSLRRRLANACLSSILVSVQKSAGARPRVHEVIGVEYRSWATRALG